MRRIVLHSAKPTVSGENLTDFFVGKLMAAGDSVQFLINKRNQFFKSLIGRRTTEMKNLLSLKFYLLILSFFVLTTSAAAQKIRFVEKPFRFPSSGNSVTLTGTATDKIRPLYAFRARKGQTISVRITSENDKAFFNVFDRAEPESDGVDGDLGLTMTNDWSYKFTATGNYELVVFVAKGAAKYTLEVKLK